MHSIGWENILPIFFLAQQFEADVQPFGSNKEYFAEPATFCDSHQRCFNRGQLKGMIGYMIGKEYHELNTLELSASGIWLNYHALVYPGAPIDSVFWTFGETLKEHNQTIYNNHIHIKWLSSQDRLAYYSTNFVITITDSPNVARSVACGYRPPFQTRSKIQLEIFRYENLLHIVNMCFPEGPKYGCVEHLQNVTLIRCAKT